MKLLAIVLGVLLHQYAALAEDNQGSLDVNEHELFANPDDTGNLNVLDPATFNSNHVVPPTITGNILGSTNTVHTIPLSSSATFTSDLGTVQNTFIPTGLTGTGTGLTETGLTGTGLTGTRITGTGLTGTGLTGTRITGTGLTGTGLTGTGLTGTRITGTGLTGTGFGTGLTGTRSVGTGLSGTGPSGTILTSTAPVSVNTFLPTGQSGSVTSNIGAVEHDTDVQGPFEPINLPDGVVKPPCPADVVYTNLKKLFNTREEIRDRLKSNIAVADTRNYRIKQYTNRGENLATQIQSDPKVPAAAKNELVRRIINSNNNLNANVQAAINKLLGSAYFTSLVTQLKEVNNIDVISRLLNYIVNISAKSNELVAKFNNLDSNYLANEVNNHTLALQDINNIYRKLSPVVVSTQRTTVV